MSLILARENASNLLDTCSRTPIMEWRTSDKSKGRKYIAKGNPYTRLTFVEIYKICCMYSFTRLDSW